MKIGFCVCGSFCTFKPVSEAMRLLSAKHDVTAILSHAAAETDTRFGSAAFWREQFEAITQKKLILTIAEAEPIGPKKLFDLLLVAPATGNTLSKMASGTADSPVSLAVKSHLRNGRPVVVAVSTNDALAANARSIGELLARRCFYFVPFRQDDPSGKPRSLVADFSLIPETVEAAAAGNQIQPLVLAPKA